MVEPPLLIRDIKQVLEEISHKKEIETINLSQGNPLGPIDSRLKAVLREYLSEDTEDTEDSEDSESEGYCASKGHPPFLKRLAEYEREHFGNQDANEERIIATFDASGGINLLLADVASRMPTSEVVVMAPHFPPYCAWIKNKGLTPKVIPFTLDDIDLLDDLEQAIGSRTGALILNSPRNPTGIIDSEYFLRGLGAILNAEKRRRSDSGSRENQIVVINDQPCRTHINGGKEMVFARDHLRYDSVVNVNSFSKEGRLAGRRLGYLEIPELFPEVNSFVDRLVDSVLGLGFVQAPTPLQYAIAEVELPLITDWSEHIASVRNYCSNLREIGYDVIEPEGGLFVCARVPEIESHNLHKALLEVGIGTVDGRAFGFKSEDGYVRLSMYDLKQSSHDEVFFRFERAYEVLRGE